MERRAAQGLRGTIAVYASNLEWPRASSNSTRYVCRRPREHTCDRTPRTTSNFEASKSCGRALAEAELLASAPVVGAAKEFAGAIEDYYCKSYSLLLFVRDFLANGIVDNKQFSEAAVSDKNDQYFAAKHKAEMTRAQFYTQARLELGIPALERTTLPGR
jgi:hypothetical protein